MHFKLTMILLATALAFTFLVAQSKAGAGWELNAADQVERVANHRLPTFTIVAACRSIARKQFTCTFFGNDGGKGCYADGRANVRRIDRWTYRTTFVSFNRRCF